MAQKAKKHVANANAAALRSLHTTSALLHTVFLALHFLWRARCSLLLYGLLSAPSLLCQYVLEVSGRPRYETTTSTTSTTTTLRSPGQDLAAPGLTEYMFDVVWLTWAALVAVVLVGNWGWLLLVAVPAYALYLVAGLLGIGGRRRRSQLAPAPPQMQGRDAVTQGNRRQRRAA